MVFSGDHSSSAFVVYKKSNETSPVSKNLIDQLKLKYKLPNEVPVPKWVKQFINSLYLINYEIHFSQKQWCEWIDANNQSITRPRWDYATNCQRAFHGFVSSIWS